MFCGAGQALPKNPMGLAGKMMQIRLQAELRRAGTSEALTTAALALKPKFTLVLENNICLPCCDSPQGVLQARLQAELRRARTSEAWATAALALKSKFTLGLENVALRTRAKHAPTWNGLRTWWRQAKNIE